MYSSIWREIRNNFIDEDENKVYIDAWKTDDDDEDGKVIAKIDIVSKEIEYLDERAKKDYYAQEIIQETMKWIEENNQ